MSSNLWIFSVHVLGVTLAILGSAGASAQSSVADPIVPPKLASVMMPTGKINSLGLTVNVTMGDRASAGLVPVQINIAALGTFPADRQFVFRFISDPSRQSPPTNGLRIDVPMSVTQGAKSTTLTRYLPKWSAGCCFQLIMLEGGRVLDDCSVQLGPAPNNSSHTSPTHLDWMLVTEDELVDFKKLPDLRALFGRDQLSQLGIRNEISPPNRDPQFWELVLPRLGQTVVGQSELASDWRAYGHLDLILFSRKSLEVTKRNQRFEPIWDWMLTGGTIVVYDLEDMDQLVNLMGLTETPSESLDKRIASIQLLKTLGLRHEIELLESEQSRLKEKLAQDKAVSTDTNSNNNGNWQETQREIDEVAKRLSLVKRTQLTIENKQSNIWGREVGAGIAMGISIDPDESFPSRVVWRTVETVMEHRASTLLRRGADPILGDRRFTSWLIPGVAQPPVYTFMGLLALFVILVGPVAYRSTAKRGRSYLMFLIAPLLAIVTTISMFAYGVVSDGFGTVTRIRQLTWVDGASGDAGERTRSTYFSGLRPVDGIRFDPGVEVMRYTDGSAGSFEELEERPPQTLGTIRLSDTGQFFDNSFLPSRQQCQFIVHQPRRKLGGVSLQLKKISDTETKATASSTLKFELREMIVRDDNGGYWYLASLPGDTSDLPMESMKSKITTKPEDRLKFKDASEILGKLYTRNRLIEEDSFSNRGNRSSYNSFTRDLISLVNQQFQSEREGWQEVMDGTFEFWLKQRLQMEGAIPKHSFIATADVSDDVIAVPTAEVVDSVRFVFGTLK